MKRMRQIQRKQKHTLFKYFLFCNVAFLSMYCLYCLIPAPLHSLLSHQNNAAILWSIVGSTETRDLLLFWRTPVDEINVFFLIEIVSTYTNNILCHHMKKKWGQNRTKEQTPKFGFDTSLCLALQVLKLVFSHLQVGRVSSHWVHGSMGKIH